MISIWQAPIKLAAPLDPPAEHLTPIGTVPIEEITLQHGVYHDDAPQPLDAAVKLE
jgi:hypothetical protein